MPIRVKIRRSRLQTSSTIPSCVKWRPNYSLKGEKWEINIYDDDPFPSVPHADCVRNHAYKINLLDGIGTIYFKGEERGHLYARDYQKLIDDIRKRDLIRKARNYYREHHPYIDLPIIDDERNAKLGGQTHSKGKSIYTFRCKWVKNSQK